MKSQNLFEVLQEGSERLTVQPSPQVWKRLEDRLESHQRRNGRVVLMRWVTAAAAMLVLLAGIYFINSRSNTHTMALTQEPLPTNLEDLVNTEGCNPYCMLLEGRKELPIYYANPVRN